MMMSRYPFLSVVQWPKHILAITLPIFDIEGVLPILPIAIFSYASYLAFAYPTILYGNQAIFHGFVLHFLFLK